MPRQQFVDLLRRMIWKFGEDIGEPRLRIDIVEFAGLCRAPNYAEHVCIPQDSS